MKFRIFSALVLIAVIMAETAMPFSVSAEDGVKDGVKDGGEAQEKSYRTTGKYSFTASLISDGTNGQEEDTFVFDEECFRESSFTGCPHLRTLSVQVGNAATTFYGDRPDKFCRDMSHASRNLEIMLSAMGFSGISINGYYNRECMEDSMGFAAARRSLDVKGKKYTLIGLFPRGDGYKEEWSGNFRVGAGNIHEGFKAVRDEGLRFLKKYINENGISGDLKIWIAAHSRGGAAADMMAGFLAGGGAAYLGDQVSVDPEDVYCYTTGAPSTIKPGTLKSEELSVSGPRGGKYEYDTEGEPYTYEGEGTFDGSEDCYGGIRCFAAGHDLITYLAPEGWGFRRYGKKCPADGTGSIYGTCSASRTVSEKEDMAGILKDLSPNVYADYTDGNLSSDFSWKTLDIAGLKIIDDPDAPEDTDITHFQASRVAALIANVPDNRTYVDLGYQETMMAAGGIFGMFFHMLGDGADMVEPSDLSTVLSLYNSYSKERKAAEEAAGSGRAEVDPTLVDEYANRLLTETLDGILPRMAARAKRLYGEDYYNEAMRQIDILRSKANQLRRILSYVLFYTEGQKHSRQDSLRTASTLISNAYSFVATHYKEIYVSWAKAAESVTECVHDSGQAAYEEEQERKRREQEEKSRKAQKISVKISGGRVRRSRVKKKTAAAASIKVKKSYGKLTYKKISGSSRLTVSRSGKIMVRKGAPRGKYRIKIRVNAAGDSRYRPGKATVSAVIRVV